MNAGLIGALLGSIIGIVGGMIGTYCSFKRAKGEKERAFVVKASVVCWIQALAFCLGMLLLPAFYKSIVIPIYVVGLMAGVLMLNKKLEKIQSTEAK